MKGRILSALIVVTAFCWPIASLAQSRCDAYFPLDGNLDDSSGSGIAGQMIGKGGVPATPQFVGGKSGQALKLDGTSAMRALVDLHFDNCPKVTLTAWVMIDGRLPGGSQNIVSTGADNGPGFRMSGPNLILNGTNNGLMKVGVMRENAGWMFIAGVYDYGTGSYTLHWRNRKLASTLAEYRYPPEDALWIGALNDGLSGAAKNIVVDELRVYGRTLTDDELHALQAGRTPGSDATNSTKQVAALSCSTSDECGTGNYCAFDSTCHPESHLPLRQIEMVVLPAPLQTLTTISSGGQGTGSIASGIPQPVPGVSDRLPAAAIPIDTENFPDRPASDILNALKTPLSRAQIVLNSQGAIAYLSVGVNVFTPWGNRNFNPTLHGWADSSKRTTEIAGVQGKSEVVAVAEFGEFDYFPKEASLERGIVRQVLRAVGNGERIDLVALPPNAATDMAYLLVTDQNVYSRMVPQAAVQHIQNALAAGEEISAVVFPTSDSFAIATSSGVFTSNLPPESNLKSHLEQLHQAGERIEDIVIHPLGFGWSGETGSYAITTNRRIVGMHVSCNSFDQARDWAQQNAVPRQISCDGDRPQTAEEIPPFVVPELELKDSQCEWSVRGSLSVNHGLPVLQTELGKSLLANVEVRVSGATPVFDGWGTWNAWPSVRTDKYGRFAVREAKGCGKRRMKLEVKFQDSELEVRHRTSTSSLTKVKWYTVEQFSENENGHIVVNDFEIGRPAGSYGLLIGDALESWWYADIWVLYKSVIDLMKSRGPDFAFRKQVKIKYPHDGIAPDERETSYANPENSVIYITSEGSFENFTVDTLLHELGHIWSYQHSADSYNMASPLGGAKRLSCLTLGFLKGMKFQTHGLVSDRCVAFYEGFAEFFKDNVAFKLFDNSYQTCRGSDCPNLKPLPFSREYLGFGPYTSNPPQPASNLELLQRHDMGWYSALHLLIDRNRGAHIYGPPFSGSALPPWFVDTDYNYRCKGPLGPQIDFWDILRSFSPGGDHTTYFRAIRLADESLFPALAPINDTRIENFLNRVAGVTGKMTSEDVQNMRRMIDPAETVEAWDLYCP